MRQKFFHAGTVICYGNYQNNNFHSTHVTARNIKKQIHDWDKIYKFVVYRKEEEIIESDYRLHMSYYEQVGLDVLNPQWEATVLKSMSENLEEFKKRRWDPWLKGKGVVEHWVGRENMDQFDVLDFYNINEEFKKLLMRFDLPVIDLEKCN